MRYRLAIFDFDGTLADSFSWFGGVMNGLADRYGFRRIEDAEIESLRGHHALQVIQHVGLPLWKLPLVAGAMRRQMTREIDSIRLFSGVDGVLERLDEAGIELAVVSSNSEENIRRVLGPRLAALVDHYECGATLFGKAPRLRKVLRASGLGPRDAILIADELRDLQAARAEGIPFGAVAWGYTSLEALLAHALEEVFNAVKDVSRKLVAIAPLPGG